MSDKPWGGRFKAATSKAVEAYTESLSYDNKLVLFDIMGSVAHCHMLVEQGILTPAEGKALEEGLEKVLAEVHEGVFPWRPELEDVHMNVERRLTEIVGEVGKKLHTARSRNDQVCLDFRLYVSSSLDVWFEYLLGLIGTFVDKAKQHRDTVMPGYTHLQPAQPVSLAHHLLAYAFMLKRDAERVLDAYERVNISPLGAAALAGTTYPIDPKKVAEDLDMLGVFDNSMDAVADRDFALEAVFCGATVMMHLSRFCEEIILWSNPQFGFITVSDGYSTGSSIMPQKKNPDVAELMRGKTGKVYGNLMHLFTLLKGLPLTYNRDLQEDKIAFFDAAENVAQSLMLMQGMLEELAFHAGKMEKALKNGFVNATELADYLTVKGVPFRDSHHITGNVVAYAEEQGIGLEDIPLGKLQEFSKNIAEDVYQVLDYKNAIKRRKSHGSTGPESVQGQINTLEEWLGEFMVTEDGVEV